MYQHTLTHLQASLREKRIVGSHKDLWHGCRLHIIKIVRNFN
jgi:hypothetical protein